jgi:hypothetical protein
MSLRYDSTIRRQQTPELPATIRNPTSVRSALRSQSCEMLLLVSLSPSACNNSAPSERIFMKIYTVGFFENLPRKLKF